MTSSSFRLTPGLREIFGSRKLLDAFRGFTANTFSEESLQFIEDVLLLKASQNLAAIDYIFVTYIVSNSPLQVNIDSLTRLATTERFNYRASKTPDEQLAVFDEALSRVAELLERDSVPKFLQQQQHEKFVPFLPSFEAFVVAKKVPPLSFPFSDPQVKPEDAQSPPLLHPAGDDSSTWYRGHLLRRAGFLGQWSPFTYMKKGSFLFEYKPGANHVKAEPLNMIPLDGSLVETASILSGKPNIFILHTTAGKSYFFQSESAGNMERWMEELCIDNSLTMQLRSRKTEQQFPSISSTQLPPKQSEEAKQWSGSIPSKEMLASAMPIFNFLLLDHFEEAVVASDSTRKIVAFNHAAERMFGFTAAEALGQPVSLLISEPYHSENVNDTLQLGNTGEPRVVPGRRKNGEIFRLVISLAELPLPGYFAVVLKQ